MKSKDPKYQQGRAECKYCLKQLVDNTPCLSENLKSCEQYDGPPPTSENGSRSASRLSMKKQAALNMPSVTPDQRHEMDIAAAMASIMGSRPLSMYEEPWMQRFLSKVSFVSFTAPARGQISNTLMNECYANVKIQVDSLVHSQHSLTLSWMMNPQTTRSEESTISQSSYPDYGSFFLMNKDMEDVILTGRAHAV